MALASLGAHRLRSMLTMAGVAIGIFSVIGVMTAISALRGSIETGLSFLGTNTFQFSKYPTGIQIIGKDRSKFQKRRNITLVQAERYRQLMEDHTDVVRFVVWAGRANHAEFSGRRTNPGVSYGGSDEHYLQTNQFEIETGNNIRTEDVALRRPVALIGQVVQQNLFPAESPLGKVIKVNGHAYTVIGTFASKGTSFGINQDEIVVVPITSFLEDNGSQNTSINIATAAPSPQSYNDTLEQAISAMRTARGLRPEDENDFDVYSNDSLIATFAHVADMVSEGAFVVSAIALLAAGVGIMNIMLVSVTERTREIGVRKSIGARRVDILTQFLLESVALSLAGAVAGIVLGVAAGDTLAAVLRASVVFPWGWAAAGLGVCTGIGVGFGLYPALRAAALDPIEALRYE